MMERDMRRRMKLMENQNFESEEEAMQFLNESANQPLPPVNRLRLPKEEQARELMYDALEQTGEKRRQLAEAALHMNPNLPDSYLILSEYAQSDEEKESLLKQGIAAGEKELGSDFFKNASGHFWGIIETRPYMRVKFAYALHLFEQSKWNEAIKVFEELLKLNPNDNQGARYLLLTCYLQANRLKEAAELLETYDEHSAYWLYSHFILYYITTGVASKRLFDEAFDSNKPVADYLLFDEPLPDELPEYVSSGDINEAVDYAARNVTLWRKHPELIQAAKRWFE